MKNDPIESALAALDEIPLHTPDGAARFRKALTGKSNLVAAKAARLIGNALWLELTADLAFELRRLLAVTLGADKGCSAKIAIARALHQLEHDDAEVFLAGMKCIQREPVWGGSEDVAAELRSICAAGLAGSTYPFKLRALVDLMADPEWRAREGAIRAISALGSDAAALLIRFKVLVGDSEPDVFSTCLAGLIELEGAAALPLVESFTANRQPEEIRDAAILALGSCRRPDAAEKLTGLFSRTIDPDSRKTILLALATSRTEVASMFLEDIETHGTPQEKAMVADALRFVR